MCFLVTFKLKDASLNIKGNITRNSLLSKDYNYTISFQVVYLKLLFLYNP
jgi:hypothetical protein